MNNKKEKTMFSVEMCEDDSGMFVKAHGRTVFVKMMIATSVAEYFIRSQGDAMELDDFIPVLKKACEDREFLEMMVQAASLYAKNEDDGLKAFAMLTSIANIERLTGRKKKEDDEKGGPVA